VEIARDGVGGIEKARTFRPDLVLCDLGLPRLDGYEVARAIRADPALCGIYLVAVTGYASSADQRRAADAGFNRHLAKPVPMDVIEEVLVTAPRVPPRA
jgi:CheY-like chemotaxis protein